MAPPIWKGHISFGLVNVPVTLASAERPTHVEMSLLDRRDTSRVRYQRVNEETGEQVPWDEIVKGYRYEKDRYVLFSEEELQQAAVAMTRAIEIVQFVELAEIPIGYFDKPYYLVPEKSGEKGYVLLREAMRRTGKVGLAQVVIRTRQYLAALVPQERALELVLLRYAQELREVSEYPIPSANPKEYKVSSKEIDLAVQLIDGMTERWQPKKFHDEYRDALMKLVQKKVKSGRTAEIAGPVALPHEKEPETLNFITALQQSMRKSTTVKKRPRKSSAAKTTAARRRKSAG